MRLTAWYTICMPNIRHKYYDATVEAGVPEAYLDKHGNKFGDCVLRTLHLATGKPLIFIIYEFMLLAPHGIRRGITDGVYGSYLRKRGWKRTKCRPCVSFNALPKRGKVIVELKDHLCYVQDGVYFDNEDWRRYGVVGYWTKKGK